MYGIPIPAPARPPRVMGSANCSMKAGSVYHIGYVQLLAIGIGVREIGDERQRTPSLPGKTKSMSDQSSASRFCSGAPVKSNRCDVRNCLHSSVICA